jgi:hypothetical protein
MNNFKKNIFSTANIEDIVYNNYTYSFSIGFNNSGLSCAAMSYPVIYYATVPFITTGTQLYNDFACTTTASGGNDLFYKSQDQDQSFQISSAGIATNAGMC